MELLRVAAVERVRLANSVVGLSSGFLTAGQWELD
jgi:hypothetical protein